jgi:cyclic pyranopterin phosphate synthase
MTAFTHFDATGNAVMVDVSAKETTARVAIAGGSVVMQQATLDLILAGGVKKGDVLSVARLAGIMGAKRTSDLIPLCHPLGLDSVTIELACDPQRSAVDITATCKITGRTGVEMEALTAVSVAALALIDMVKAVDPAAVVTDVRVQTKTGGAHGDWHRGRD